MNSEKYSRNVELRCPSCTGTQFEHGEDIDSSHTTVHCIGCGRDLTKDELIRENSENIDAHVAEIGEEVVRDFAKEMGKGLKSALRGSKHFKLK